MSLVKSAARRLQSHPTFALLVSIFFALTGLQLASVFSRTNFPEPHYGLCATYRSIVAFASHPYMLLKRVSLHFEGKDSGVRSLRKLDSQKYWETVARNRKRFRRNEARPVDDPFDLESGNASTRVEYLITYYKPQLLPQYREPRKPDPDALELVIPSKVFIAWHALVYPNKIQPTTQRASKMLDDYSTRDRREILRMTKLAKQRCAGKSTVDGTYKDMWKKYLKNKGPDIVICFAA